MTETLNQPVTNPGTETLPAPDHRGARKRPAFAKSLTADRDQRRDIADDKPDLPGLAGAGRGRRRLSRSGLILATVLTGQFMTLLDASIVNVAVPTIHTELKASGAGLQLIVAGYIIAYAVLLVTGARLGRIFGQGRLFKLGLIGFTLTSLACGLAGNTGELIGFRVLQGMSSAAMVPQVLSLIQSTFVGEARAKAMSAWTAVLASGIVVGQVLGGVLVTANIFGLSWRPVFLVNVPIGIVLLFASQRSLPARAPSAPGVKHAKLDIAGVLTLSPTILAFVVPLVLGHDENWPLWGWVMLGSVLPLLALFLFVENRVAARGGSPLLPSKVLRIPGMKPSMLLIFAVMVVYSGNLFSTAIHLQTAVGFTALHTGLAFAPSAFAFGVVSFYWRRIPTHLIRRASVFGLFLAVVGIALQVPLFSGGGAGGVWLYADQFLIGIGIGLGNAPTMTSALMKVPVEDASDASGLLTTTSQLAQVVGIATLGTVYLSVAPGHVIHAAGHAMAVMSLAAAVVTLAAVAFGTHLHLVDHKERRAARASALTD